LFFTGRVVGSLPVTSPPGALGFTFFLFVGRVHQGHLGPGEWTLPDVVALFPQQLFRALRRQPRIESGEVYGSHSFAAVPFMSQHGHAAVSVPSAVGRACPISLPIAAFDDTPHCQDLPAGSTFHFFFATSWWPDRPPLLNGRPLARSCSFAFRRPCPPLAADIELFLDIEEPRCPCVPSLKQIPYCGNAIWECDPLYTTTAQLTSSLYSPKILASWTSSCSFTSTLLVWLPQFP